jgi:hypothetical protein
MDNSLSVEPIILSWIDWLGNKEAARLILPPLQKKKKKKRLILDGLIQTV